MTELQLYSFFIENKVECHFNHDETEVNAFIDFCDIADFNKLIGSSITDEEGINCVFKDGYFCFEMVQICEYFGIEYKNVFTDKIIS